MTTDFDFLESVNLEYDSAMVLMLTSLANIIVVPSSFKAISFSSPRPISYPSASLIRTRRASLYSSWSSPSLRLLFCPGVEILTPVKASIIASPAKMSRGLCNFELPNPAPTPPMPAPMTQKAAFFFARERALLLFLVPVASAIFVR